MKAARLYGIEDIRVEDIPIPEINEDEVLIKVKASFICGTDVRFYKNGLPGNSDQPLVAGHEIAGVVEKVGARIKGYAVGTRVGVAPNYGCGVCDLCTSGNSHMCLESEALGVSVDGGFAEYMRVPAAAVAQGNISPLEDSISFEEAALAEPLSCVYNAYEKIGIYPGDHVLVIGAGPIGLMHIRVAFLAGAAAVYVTDLSEDRLALAKKLIPEVTVLKNETLDEDIKKYTGGRLMNLVITAASVSVIQESAFKYVGLDGRVMFFGGLPKGKSIVKLDTNEIHYKQLTVAGTTRQSLRQYRLCLKLIASGRLKVSDLVTASAPLDDINSIIANVAAGKGLKSVITI
ncbi:alcohol dehydrogenase catalytic domain-containing protein [Oceanispirochaeta sp.]|uniref:alcohol dehydrogenase catalytic domain-containing protein n=1 Tax=Oceanispirochaeta sp. TaxID=2035350 RepID=UPI00262D5877|nr:alcohol dehydrogenase catalytic domain-containing protein [Oceanispirochaeta sp.]MDA3959068.1 alcohol dehydrogenase catalytic domain-containing protein [Oceanispirochaeta sp.]